MDIFTTTFAIHFGYYCYNGYFKKINSFEYPKYEYLPKVVYADKTKIIYPKGI